MKLFFFENSLHGIVVSVLGWRSEGRWFDSIRNQNFLLTEIHFLFNFFSFKLNLNPIKSFWIILTLFTIFWIDDLLEKADRLRDEIRDIQGMRQAQEGELAAIENAALKQRFQKQLSKLIAQEQEKKEEVI